MRKYDYFMLSKIIFFLQCFLFAGMSKYLIGFGILFKISALLEVIILAIYILFDEQLKTKIQRWDDEYY